METLNDDKWVETNKLEPKNTVCDCKTRFKLGLTLWDKNYHLETMIYTWDWYQYTGIGNNTPGLGITLVIWTGPNTLGLRLNTLVMVLHIQIHNTIELGLGLRGSSY